MEKRYSLIEFIQKLPGWIIGLITFLTVIVSFTILFRDNIELVVLIIIASLSLGAIGVCLVIIFEKTPPLIEGGKGVYKYPKFQLLAKYSFALILVVNLIFFTTQKGNELLLNAFTETAIPTLISPPITSSQNSTSTPFAASNIQLPKDILAVSNTISCQGGNFMIPKDVDLSQPALILMNSLYKQKVWESWEIVDFNPGLSIEITNTQATGQLVNIDNSAIIVIDNYEPIDHMNIASFSLSSIWAGENYCGGGGTAHTLSPVFLRNTDYLTSVSDQYDYFTLEPGELEMFNISFLCGQPGIYQYHVEIVASFLGQESKLIVSPNMKTYCPESYSEWIFTDVTVDSTDKDNLDPHTVKYTGDYVLSKQYVGGEGIAREDSPDVYLLTNPVISWTETRPWKPCADAPESNIFNDRTNSIASTINSELEDTINVRDKPGLEAQIINLANPGQVVYIEGGPVCSNGFVWWEVTWPILDNQDNVKRFISGWVAEGDENMRWIIP